MYADLHTLSVACPSAADGGGDSLNMSSGSLGVVIVAYQLETTSENQGPLFVACISRSGDDYAGQTLRQGLKYM